MLFGPPPSILAGLNGRPGAAQAAEAQREVGRGDDGVAPVLRLAPGVRGAAADDGGEIARPAARAGERAVGQRRFVGQAEVAPRRGRREQRRRARRRHFLVGVEHDLEAEPRAERRGHDRFERGEHDRDAALHVGDAGAVEVSASSQRHVWNG